MTNPCILCGEAAYEPRAGVGMICRSCHRMMDGEATELEWHMHWFLQEDGEWVEEHLIEKGEERGH